MTSMQNTHNGRGKKSDKTGQPFFPHAKLSTTKGWGLNPSTGPIAPVAVSLAEDQKSIDGQTSFKDAEYNIIDRDYERAKDDTAETLAEARSRLYWMRVWNQATSTSLASRASKHVLTVGENIGVDDQANTLGGICSGSNHSEGVEPLEYCIDSSPISSNLSSFVAKTELKIIHDMKSVELWTFVEAPDVEDDWDLISEANCFRNAFTQPTFNALLRERLGALRFQRESMKRKYSDIHQAHQERRLVFIVQFGLTYFKVIELKLKHVSTFERNMGLRLQ